MGIEWSGHQQLLFFVRSIVIGLIIGIMFDVFTGWGRIRRTSVKTYVLDIVFCLFASLVTFFAALIIMNGQLHPLLFIGIGVGAIIIHVIIGRYISAAVAYVGRLCSRIRLFVSRLLSGLLGIFSYSIDAVKKKYKKKSKNSEKIEDLM